MCFGDPEPFARQHLHEQRAQEAVTLEVGFEEPDGPLFARRLDAARGGAVEVSHETLEEIRVLGDRLPEADRVVGPAVETAI